VSQSFGYIPRSVYPSLLRIQEGSDKHFSEIECSLVMAEMESCDLTGKEAGDKNSAPLFSR
jgi:hypothetical protein